MKKEHFSLGHIPTARLQSLAITNVLQTDKETDLS